MNIRAMNGVKSKKSGFDISSDKTRKTLVKMSQGTETDLLGEPSKRQSSIHINIEES